MAAQLSGSPSSTASWIRPPPHRGQHCISPPVPRPMFFVACTHHHSWFQISSSPPQSGSRNCSTLRNAPNSRPYTNPSTHEIVGISQGSTAAARCRRIPQRPHYSVHPWTRPPPDTRGPNHFVAPGSSRIPSDGTGGGRYRHTQRSAPGSLRLRTAPPDNFMESRHRPTTFGNIMLGLGYSPYTTHQRAIRRIVDGTSPGIRRFTPSWVRQRPTQCRRAHSQYRHLYRQPMDHRPPSNTTGNAASSQPPQQQPVAQTTATHASFPCRGCPDASTDVRRPARSL